MRRFQTNTMEKVLENENEKIYGEFEVKYFKNYLKTNF